LAWGRYKAETGPQPNLRTAIEAKGFLDGFFDALNLWARDNDTGAQRIMLDLYPLGMKKDPINRVGHDLLQPRRRLA